VWHGFVARRPLSRAGKEIILVNKTTDVGVDAVLSADVGGAPIRQAGVYRQGNRMAPRVLGGCPP